MTVVHSLFISLFTASTIAQSVKSLGHVGGSGPKGGCGDVDKPVLEAQSYVVVKT